MLACACARVVETVPPAPRPATAAADPYAQARRRMLDEHLFARGVRDPAVLRAMARVPRHELVPPELRPQLLAGT